MNRPIIGMLVSWCNGHLLIALRTDRRVAAVGLDKLGRSFQYALAGLVYALQTQRNVRIHLIAAIIVLGAGLYFRISSRDFVLLFFAITLVLMAEMFNTALEKAVDLFVQEYSHLAKIAKDAAAGAVLVTALNALVVGYVVFYPRLASLAPCAGRAKVAPLLVTLTAFSLVFLLTVAGKAWGGRDNVKEKWLPGGRAALAFAGGTALILLTGELLVATIALFLVLLAVYGGPGPESRTLAGVISGALLGILVTLAVFKLAGW